MRADAPHAQDEAQQPTHLPTDTTDTSLAQADAATSQADAADDASGAEDMTMFIQVRPMLAATSKAKIALERLGAQHPDARYTVAGISKDGRFLRITLAINLGPRDQIARFSPQATAAYAFVQDLFERLSDHLPQYCEMPSAEEASAAAFYPEVVEQIAAQIAVTSNGLFAPRKALDDQITPDAASTHHSRVHAA